MNLGRFQTDVIILIFGVALGVLIQTVITMTMTNGHYENISSRRLWGMRLMGGVLALSAGLGFLATQTITADGSSFDTAYKLLTAQVLSAIAGGEGYRRWRESKGGSDAS